MLSQSANNTIRHNTNMDELDQHSRALLANPHSILIAECTCGLCFDAYMLKQDVALAATHNNTRTCTLRQFTDMYRTPCCGEFPQHWVR